MSNTDRRTVDLGTGKLFRWNATVIYDGRVVPARVFKHRDCVFLPPDRVKPFLLAELNFKPDDPIREVKILEEIPIAWNEESNGDDL